MLAHPLRRACSSGPQVNGVHRRTEDSIWLELRGDHLADNYKPTIKWYYFAIDPRPSTQSSRFGVWNPSRRQRRCWAETFAENRHVDSK